MSELAKMRSELSKKEAELKDMTSYVKHDQEWISAAQEKGDYAEWKEFSDPRKARQLQEEIKSLKDRVDNYEYYEEKRKEEERKIEFQKWRDTNEQIKSNAKALYDEKMNAYMSMNFWGKAKTILAGKKPKKMSNMEIMQTYGQIATKQELDKLIAYKRQDLDRNIEWTKQYYTEHPEALKPDSDIFNSIENIIKYKERSFQFEVARLTEDYENRYNHIMEQGEKWGMKL